MEPTAEWSDETLLLDLLNTTPVVDGEARDLLGDPAEAGEWARSRGGTGSPAEARQLRRTRDQLQAVVRGDAAPASLAGSLRGVRLLPALGDAGVSWQLDVEDDRRLAIRAVLAWARLQQDLPGRLRACANHECRLFLIDHSRANGARWCSMKTCGNRMKARRHYQRGQVDQARK